MAVDTVVLPGTPLQYLAQVDGYTADSVEVTFTPLSLDMGSTTDPREALDEYGFTITASIGSGPAVQLDLGELQIPGEANPITGSDIVSTLILSASTAAGGLCGTADGMVTLPHPCGPRGLDLFRDPVAHRHAAPGFPVCRRGSRQAVFYAVRHPG